MMFGRLDEDPELSREYMIVSNSYNADPVVFEIMAAPQDARSMIVSELSGCRNLGFAVYELVEFVEVDKDGKCEFTEDWAIDRERKYDDEQED